VRPNTSPPHFYRACQHIVKLIRNHDEWNYFQSEVDTDIVIDYRAIVTDPITLTTIQSKLAHVEYGSYDQFANDVDIMLSNCVLYHDRGITFRSDYRDLAEKASFIQHVIEEAEGLLRAQGKLDSMPKRRRRMSTAKMATRVKTLQLKVKQLQKQNFRCRLQHPSATHQEVANTFLEQSSSTAIQAALAKTHRLAQPATLPSSLTSSCLSPHLLGPLDNDDEDDQSDCPAMSFEDKTELLESIQKMEVEYLDGVFVLLDQHPNADGEVELCLEYVDNSTLWKVHQYVYSCLQPSKPSPRQNFRQGVKRARDVVEETDCWFSPAQQEALQLTDRAMHTTRPESNSGSDSDSDRMSVGSHHTAALGPGLYRTSDGLLL